MRRGVRLALVVAVVAGSLALPVAADSPSSANATADTENYTYDELARYGDRAEGLMKGEHWLGQYGTVVLTYEPVDPKSPAWVYLTPGETLQTRTVSVDAIRLGDDIDESLNVTVVAWEKGEKVVPVGNTTKTVEAATNVTSFTKTVTLEQGRDEAEITLPARYDQGPYQITMWIEEEPDARWRFQLNPVPFGQPMDINSEGDFWATAFWWIILPVTVGAGSGVVSAKKALDQIKVGTGYGFKFWGAVTALSLILTALFGWYHTVVLLDRAPWIVGGLILAITLAMAIEILDRKAEIVAFERDELQDAKSPAGEDVVDSLYQEVKHHRVVEENGVLYFVPRGIINALARFWADPPTVPMEELKTQIEVRGSLARKFVADPHEESAVDAKPARFAIHSPIRHDIDLDEDAGLLEKLKLIRWGLFAKSAFVFPIVMIGVDIWFGLTGLATVLGLVAVAAVWITALDGEATFNAAPIHQTSARATITAEGTEYDDAATIESERREKYDALATTSADVLEAVTARDETVSQRLNRRELGIDPEELNGGDEDDE
ncbi:MAG: hypothetical protein ABEI98_01545 [Halorhabdus sp.]